MFKKNASFIIILCLFVLALSSCKKDPYLSGGSLHTAVTPLNNIEYLRGNQMKLFDTMILVAERFNLVTEINNAKTFFAFTDYSIQNMINLRLVAKQLVDPSARYTLDSLMRDITADSVRQYMFNETIELSTAPELKAAPYTSIGKTTMGALKQLQGPPYLDRTSEQTFLLFFVKVRGALDEPGVVPPVNQNDILVVCQTTGIKTSNGETTLHVLANTHNFVRF